MNLLDNVFIVNNKTEFKNNLVKSPLKCKYTHNIKIRNN